MAFPEDIGAVVAGQPAHLRNDGALQCFLRIVEGEAALDLERDDSRVHVEDFITAERTRRRRVHAGAIERGSQPLLPSRL